MGTPKPLIDWFGAPLIQRQVEALLGAGVDEVFAVTGNEAEEVEAVLSGFVGAEHVHGIRNTAFLTGKTTSVKAGLNALPSDVDAILVLAVDQPRPSWLIREVLESHKSTGALISSPVYEGHGGHPLVFDGSLLGELKAITEEGQGVREVVQAHTDSMNRHFIDTPLVQLDMNTQEEATAARKLFPDPRVIDG
ncbi:MAG: nucleotidyltransferase family protein [Chloroflexi bacterium]|jgi:molybdenum cofactor cytidylyltransferase|nr:nucleotidyltransferase family protein [Chloroflexota bacterium]